MNSNIEQTHHQSFENIKQIDKDGTHISSVAMLLQLKAFSKKRITSKIGKVAVDDFKIS